ncbi:MAG: hypothetical protein ACI81R_000568 [Bradymonadia bacterium]|jgi:hypothetical protein
MLPKLPKDFFQLAGLTHVGVGVAFTVVIAIVGYSQLSDCGPVVVSSNYGSSDAMEAANAAANATVAVEADHDSEHAAEHAEGESH